MGAFYHAYCLSMFYSRVFDFDSGNSHNYGHDAGCEGSAFVSNDRLWDVGVLSEYVHEGVHYRFFVWFVDRDSKQIMREVIARRQDVRIPIWTGQFAYKIDLKYVFGTIAGVIDFLQRRD